MKKRMILIGPNGVGKTKIAYQLARRHNGEIINLDRTYLYKGFPIATGLQDALREQGVRRHLYQLLTPEQPAFSAEQFSNLVIQTQEQVSEASNIIIAEGASTVYVPELLRRNSKTPFFHEVIGLQFPEGADVKSKYRARIDLAFREGLAEEIRANLAVYEESYLIKECHAAIPTVRFVKGQITLNEAKEEILNRCLEYKDRQLEVFSGYPEIRWIEATSFEATYAAVERTVFNSQT